MIPAKKFGAKSITYLAYTDVMHSLCRLSSLVVLLKATCVYFLSIKAEKDFRQVCLRVDLGTRGGCHRSLQQVQVAQLQPQLAWFQLPKGPVFSRERAQDPKFKAQLHKRRKVSRNVIAISQAQLRHGDCV